MSRFFFQYTYIYFFHRCIKLLLASIDFDIGHFRNWLHKNCERSSTIYRRSLLLNHIYCACGHVCVCVKVANLQCASNINKNRIDHMKSEVKRDKKNINIDTHTHTNAQNEEKRRTNELDTHTPLNHYLKVYFELLYTHIRLLFPFCSVTYSQVE